MTPEEKSLLERTYKLAEENNEILVALRRSNRISSTLRGIYWAVIIAASFGALYFIQPYINTMLSLTDSLGGLTGLQKNLNDTLNNSGLR